MPTGISRFVLFGGAGAALGLLLSCEVGSDYARPQMDVPATYRSATSGEAATHTSALATDWWRLFNDPDLTRLEEAALGDNPDLKAAMARVAEARAAAAQVESQYYPQITFDPSISAAYSGRTTPTSPHHWTSPTRLPFDLSYEVDLWGQVARAVESAGASLRASADQYAVVRQTLAADIAQNYVNLRALEDQDDILTENIKLTGEQLDLIKRKAQPAVGLAGNIDVAQAQTLYEALRAQQVDIRRQRTDVQHALAILVGKAPAEFSLGRTTRALAVPGVPAGLPADILRHRPDVVAAEQNLIAANAQIGVALANFYPTVRLTGSAGMASVDVQHVLDWQNALMSLGPSVSIPIFEGNRLQAGLDQAQARYAELLAVYRGALLGAFRDVEVSLTDVHMRTEALEAQQQAVASAKEYRRLAQLEFEQGLISTLQLMDADRTLLSNQLTEAQLLNQRLVSTVLLIKALGGGWDAEAPLAFNTPSDGKAP